MVTEHLTVALLEFVPFGMLTLEHLTAAGLVSSSSHSLFIRPSLVVPWVHLVFPDLPSAARGTAQHSTALMFWFGLEFGSVSDF
jgi:hypothetical protein